MQCKDLTSVIHLRKCDLLSDEEINILSLIFRLKSIDKFNVNRLLIDLSFVTKIKRSFGTKPHELLIFYITEPLKLIPINNDFIHIINSQDNKEEYEKLSQDSKYFSIGNSRIAKLEPYEVTRINKIIKDFFPHVTQTKQTINLVHLRNRRETHK